jgi:hypothetical protein
MILIALRVHVSAVSQMEHRNAFGCDSTITCFTRATSLRFSWTVVKVRCSPRLVSHDNFLSKLWVLIEGREESSQGWSVSIAGARCVPNGPTASCACCQCDRNFIDHDVACARRAASRVNRIDATQPKARIEIEEAAFDGDLVGREDCVPVAVEGHPDQVAQSFGCSRCSFRQGRLGTAYQFRACGELQRLKSREVHRNVETFAAAARYLMIAICALIACNLAEIVAIAARNSS